ncbi:MAG: hypothetical protein ACLP0J_01270 [Solirubrobacteraceae bacterium]
MMLRELLDGVSTKHRAAVADRIGLSKRATAAEIATALMDDQRLQEVVAGLSAEARGFAARQVLGEAGPQYGAYYHSSGGEAGAEELERCGLAFAFRDSWRTDYVVPGDVLGPLGQALATAHLTGRGRRAATAQRWIGAPLQLAHDAAAVWAALHRDPVRVKTDGEIYQRSWPKLRATLAPIEVDKLDEMIDDRRLVATLEFLREAGCLRLRLDSDGGWETKRELIATGELLELLSREPDDLRARLLRDAGCEPMEMAGLTLLVRLGAAVAISLTSLGRAVREYTDEATRYPSKLSDPDAQVGARAIAIAWLVGLAEIGVDGAGRPCAVRLACVDVEASGGPVAICQGNFELVVLAVPAPADRLRLELTCEAVPGQPHVYTITKRSAVVAERAGVHPDGALGILRRLAGELPQNVERTVTEWVAGHGPPLHVRTAMMLDAGDPATADRLAGDLLAGLVVARIGESLLAFPAARMDDVRHALASVGRELAPGLDQISGSWSERRPVRSEAQSEWEPRAGGDDAPGGRLVSTLRKAPPGRSAARRQPAPGAPAAPTRPLKLASAPIDDEPELPPLDEILEESEIGEDGDQGEDSRPLDVILDAIEDETDVRITYAGADGITRRTITPIEIKGVQVHALCHASADEHRFWIPSILAAVPAHD